MSGVEKGSVSVVIIGGGASGVLLAAHLLRDPAAGVSVTLIERRGQFGQGLAYSASQRDHRVNVPARGMSAFSDDPGHFARWLDVHGHGSGENGWVFVPRRLYGAYLNDVLEMAGQSRPGRLAVRSDEVVSVIEAGLGMETVLGDGTVLASDHVALAVGHETQPSRGRGIAVRVGSAEDTPLPQHAEVMILGSGLSMVDAWVSLSEAAHAGPITVVSRNGLLPKGHKDVPALAIDAAQVPLGASPVVFIRWFRDLVRQTEAEGGNWRSVVDGLRPFNQRIWQSWTRAHKRQFLRHLRPWWNVHRHRLPPELYSKMVAAIDRGQVKLVAGEFVGVEQHGEGVAATVRPRGAVERQVMAVSRVYDCGGVSVDVQSSSNPVIQELIATGAARPDALRIGLDVDEQCAVIDAEGNANPHLLAIGPLTRGRFFEIEAIPDIRVQAANLAARLLGSEIEP